MANALLIAFLALGATSFLFYDPFKTPWIVMHRRETPLVPYAFLPTFLVILAVFEGGWFLLNALPSGPSE
jgi:hypothetical protein